MKTQNITAKREKFKIKRPGIHAKTKFSKVKGSKLYKKRYVGQGKN